MGQLVRWLLAGGLVGATASLAALYKGVQVIWWLLESGVRWQMIAPGMRESSSIDWPLVPHVAHDVIQ